MSFTRCPGRLKCFHIAFEILPVLTYFYPKNAIFFTEGGDKSDLFLYDFGVGINTFWEVRRWLHDRKAKLFESCQSTAI